ncbi:hypothetical protein AAULR_25566 [Lacticaseibacillus rhamnosus MTCC 5462]|nr:hypothetical protein AAULR_25566 [Lacticaseibacillus rhamnosus MTCC 5462]
MSKLQVRDVGRMPAFADGDDVINDWTHRVWCFQSLVYRLAADATDILCLKDDPLVLLKGNPVSTRAISAQLFHMSSKQIKTGQIILVGF